MIVRAKRRYCDDAFEYVLMSLMIIVILNSVLVMIMIILMVYFEVVEDDAHDDYQ